MTYRIISLFICLSFIIAPSAMGRGAEIITAYEIKGEEVSVFTSSLPKVTDLEGRLKEKTAFYFLKFKYKNNFYNFNLPAGTYKKLAEKQRGKLIEYLLGLYDRAFEVFEDIFGYIPEGYKFNITFGKTKMGNPFNYVYLATKTSNIFPDFLPYSHGREVMTTDEQKIMFHEIGHSVYGIIIGSMRAPRNKSFEEGFVDYFAEEATGEKIERRGILKVRITQEQAKRMKGLTQPDIDASVWNEEIALKPSTAKGYIGVTHHVFGLEFIHAFIDTFDKKDLPEFLTRLRQRENDQPVGDLGTSQVKDILLQMGYADKEIKKFEKDLHARLKKNVFSHR